MLAGTEDLEECEGVADQILKLNKNNYQANSTKAKADYSKGDFTNIIFYKRRAIEYSKYSLNEYMEYLDMLYDGDRIYGKREDQSSSETCAEYMLEVPGLLEEVLSETDTLAYKIMDEPELELPKRYEKLLKRVEHKIKD